MCIYIYIYRHAICDLDIQMPIYQTLTPIGICLSSRCCYLPVQDQTQCAAYAAQRTAHDTYTTDCNSSLELPEKLLVSCGSSRFPCLLSFILLRIVIGI